MDNFFFFFQAEDGIRDKLVTGVQTCALPICDPRSGSAPHQAGRAADLCHLFGAGRGERTADRRLPGEEWRVRNRAARRGMVGCLRERSAGGDRRGALPSAVAAAAWHGWFLRCGAETPQAQQGRIAPGRRYSGRHARRSEGRNRGAGGMTTRIRRARRSDAAAIGRVHVETWQSSYAGLLPDALLVAMSDVRQSAWWSRALDDPRQARGIFVADDDEMGVVGFTSGGPTRDTPEGLDGVEARVGEVYTLYVEPDFQNRGLGRALLDALFGQFVADGYDTAILWMLAENPTRFFYEAL